LVSLTPVPKPVALRTLLAALDQRQDQLARVAGIDPGLLSNYLAGKRALSDDQLKRLEMALLVYASWMKRRRWTTRRLLAFAKC
jgi:transcriptional regulator with XRE-family HTH domain